MAVVLVSAVLLVTTTSGAARALPGLHVEGGRLLLDGRPVVLRGVAMGDPLMARRAAGGQRPLSDYAEARDWWHANVVRLSVHPSEWRHARASLLAALDADVGAALRQGLCVIIDWHSIGWPDGAYQKPDPRWGDPPDLYDSGFSLAQSFWAAMAKRFAARPRVAFELWNEPVADSDRTGPWGPQWERLRPYWQRLLAAVRRRAGNLVIVTGNGWAHDLRGVREDPLRGTNIAYSWHVYSGKDGNDAVRLAQHLDGVQRVAPVIVTEWGFEPDGGQYPGTAESFGYFWVKRFLDGRKLGSTAWAWHPDWTPALLEHDWRTPTAYGAFVRQYLGHRPPSVAVANATGSEGGTATVSFTVHDAGDSVQLWLRVDDRPARALGWLRPGRFTAPLAHDLPRGRHLVRVTAEDLIARRAWATASLTVR